MATSRRPPAIPNARDLSLTAVQAALTNIRERFGKLEATVDVLQRTSSSGDSSALASLQREVANLSRTISGVSNTGAQALAQQALDAAMLLHEPIQQVPAPDDAQAMLAASVF